MSIRVFLFLALLLLSSTLLQVAICEPDPDADVESSEVAKDLGIVGDDVLYDDGNFSPAPGVETTCLFPKNPSKLVVAGEESELLVGLKNDGESNIKVIAVQASVHLPYDHKYIIQNLTAQVFNNASVPPSAQAAFPYAFSVSKFFQSGTFDLVGTIVYEIDQYPYQNTFYNGTIEVAEAGDLFSVESALLAFFGIALIGLLGLWIRSQVQNLSKKTKRAPKVEIGTKATDASLDEWLQGTAFSQSQSNKSKKKK
ncbi:translocon-associated protein subunit alpha-like [Andrographis paniculata]|uniref:translocon-associated protein subunit alpha-like n=1 Tax=Andrographis paniculata TaxID=175694 RepID=UPI0021E8A3C7|nr:translocon-associated protein subunit alpha-like [Andrographis paniculata]XP_051138436.1 translocon-associated protein subunit alpha-like [Andrographis paniculata]